MSVLAARLLAVHAALDAAELPHAFGGAIALAYYTYEPRATRDVDVNVFVGTSRADDVLAAMPDDVSVTGANRVELRRTGQVRVMWSDTPIDVFLDTHEFHRDAAAGAVTVPFDDRLIPVLGAEALVVFKAMFNRTKDWADIEAVLATGYDGRPCLERLRSLLGPADPAVVRLATLLPGER